MEKWISYRRIKETYSKKGYKFFKDPYDLNLFGIRSSNKNAGFFDDAIGVAYLDDKYRECMLICKGTTDPSKRWLLKPLNPNGTLILLEGQHRGVLRLGIHGRTWASGGYPAFEQIKDMLYVRDNNRDGVLDFDSPNKVSGNFKTNIHRASKWEIVDRVGSYSAGCQVVLDPDKYDQLYAIGEKQKEHIGVDTFSYTLFNERDI